MSKELIVKPCQSGKTSVVLKGVMDIIQEDEDSIHILYTDNNLLHVDQLNSRIKPNNDNDIYKSQVKSSKNRIKWKEIGWDILQGDCKTLIACINKAQFEGLNKILNSNVNDKKFYIWIDEADKFMKGDLYHDFVKIWSEFECVKKICYITATPENILKQESSIAVLDIDESFNEEEYLKFNECDIIIKEPNNKIDKEPRFLNYIKEIVLYSKPGEVYFIPGRSLTRNHYDIKDILVKQKFNVLTVNTDGKNLYYHDGGMEKISQKDDNTEQLSDIIGKYYTENNLHLWKFAIVGNFSVSRGISIQSKNMIFTHAIFATELTDKSSLYQLAGRVCGNIKGFDIYKRRKNKTKIFCNKKFQKLVELAEYQSIELIKVARQSYDNTITYKEFKNIRKDKDGEDDTDYSNFITDMKVFKLKTENDKYLNFIAELKSKGFTGVKKHIYDKMKCNQYTASAAGKSKVFELNELLQELSNFSNISGFDVEKKLDKKRDGFNNAKIRATRTYVCYEDISDLSSVCCIIRYGSD